MSPDSFSYSISASHRPCNGTDIVRIVVHLFVAHVLVSEPSKESNISDQVGVQLVPKVKTFLPNTPDRLFSRLAYHSHVDEDN